MVSKGQATQNDYDFAKSKLQECDEHSKRCAKREKLKFIPRHFTDSIEMYGSRH